jgi:hypothetical protein
MPNWQLFEPLDLCIEMISPVAPELALARIRSRIYKITCMTMTTVAKTIAILSTIKRTTTIRHGGTNPLFRSHHVNSDVPIPMQPRRRNVDGVESVDRVEDAGVLDHPPIDVLPRRGEVVETKMRRHRRRGPGMQTIQIYNTLVVRKCRFEMDEDSSIRYEIY